MTLSRKAERTAVIKMKATMIRQGSPLAFFAAAMAANSKRPDSFTTDTKSIMPSRTPIVLKSMWLMPVSKEMTPVMMRISAPARAATHR